MEEPTPAIPAPRSPHPVPLALLLGAAFGLLGDILFYRAGLGINAAVWAWALGIVGAVADRRGGATAAVPIPILTIACFFAAGLAWRASPFLRFWDAAAVAAATVVLILHSRGVLRVASLTDYVRGVRDLAGGVAVGPVRAVLDAPWLDAARRGHRGPAVATGMALAVPVVVVFGSLMAAADPTMETAVRALFAWEPETVVTHLMLVGGSAWLATGWLRRLAAGGGPRRQPATNRGRTLADVSLAIPLGALVALLAAFIGLQSRYLFGGEAFLRLTGTSYAEFARRGFFELVALAALTLPVLLGTQRLVDRATPASVRSFRALAPTLAALVCLIMASAVGRMWLYVRMYGLTEDRLYATAFMLWLGAVLVWFVATELGGRRERLATGGVAAGFVLLAALNVMNPDAVIARVNLARVDAAVALDHRYLARLSTDAIPAIAARWATLDRDTRCALQDAMARAAAPDDDWRAWTWSAWRAARAARTVSKPDACTRVLAATSVEGEASGAHPRSSR